MVCGWGLRMIRIFFGRLTWLWASKGRWGCLREARVLDWYCDAALCVSFNQCIIYV
jgi:hypothetical protein